MARIQKEIMASITSTYTGMSRPKWLGEQYRPDILLPGGVLLDAAAFPAPTPPNTVKRVLSGTLIGRTYAERDSGAKFGPFTTGDEEVYLVFADTSDLAFSQEAAVVRNMSVVVLENWLPGWAALAAATKTVIRSKYQTMAGALVGASPMV